MHRSLDLHLTYFNKNLIPRIDKGYLFVRKERKRAKLRALCVQVFSTTLMTAMTDHATIISSIEWLRSLLDPVTRLGEENPRVR